MSALIYEKRGRIAYITLNRPTVLNAINSEVWDGLIQSWINVRDDPEVWIAIVTGAGKKAFSAGADLKETAEHFAIPEEVRPPKSPTPDITPMRGIEVWKPFIAAINGICYGAGLELAMACDIRVAADTASFGLPEVRHAVIAGMSGTQKLPRLVPFGMAMEMLLTGDFINAGEAYRIGLVNRVLPSDQVMPTAEAMAKRICENGPLAVRASKELACRGTEVGLLEGLRLEQEIGGRLSKTKDVLEGPKAFAEKRKPVYTAE